jgi:hypothetical protein
MLTTTRRGWWLALEPALLAFTVVVCGSVSLLANSRASAFDRDHQCDTSSSIPSTATAASHDSFDDGDDDGDVGVALLALPIILTSDEGPDAPLVQIEFDVLLSLRSERVSSRGPPDRNLASCSSDDSDDDDDDDDDTGDLGSSSFASGAGQSCILIISEFDERCSFASDNHSLRAPPQ